MNHRTALLPLVLLAMPHTGCSINEIGMRSIVGDVYGYLAPEDPGPTFIKLTDHVYTFRWSYYRTIAIVTDEGLVLTDPLNKMAATLLKQELDKVAPGKKVHTLIYSHYHVDHVSGGAVFAPEQVIAHAKCPSYWEQIDSKEVLPPTKLIEGDETLTVGGVEIRLIYLGNSHSDTLYAIHLPGERLLFTADVGLVKTFPPIGGPMYFYPGVMKALEKLAMLDFDIFVPSHWGYGKKQDLVDYLEFMKYSVDLGHQAIEKYGLEPKSKSSSVDMWNFFYEPMKAKYKTWWGFDQMVLFTYTRIVVGEQLGF